MSSVGRKKISKKTKSGWRKVDINDVEEYLEEKRQEERIGAISEKKNEDLFIIDKSPLLDKTQGSLTGKQKRKLNAKKPLRSLEPLINSSHVQDPIVKRNHVKQKQNRRDIEEEVLNPTKPTHIQANKDRVIYYKKLEKKDKRNRIDGKIRIEKDIWEKEDFRDKIPALKDEKGWIGYKLSLHVANNIGQKVVKVPEQLRHRPTKAKNFEQPHPGISYNPSLESHQELVQKVVEKEEKIIKEEKHLKRVTTEMFCKVTAAERDRRHFEEMACTEDKILDEHNSPEEIFALENVSKNPPIKNRKKTRQDRNREQRHKELLKKQREVKAFKKHLAELNRLKSLRAEIIKEEEEVNELKKRRKKAAIKKKFEPKRLSRQKFVEGDIDLNEAEDIAGNLRNVKPESSLLVDRFKSFQRRNILPASSAVGKQKKKKIKRYPRSSHKDPGVSYQDLRRSKNKKE